MATKRGTDRGRRDPNPEVLQLALDALVAPAWVRLGQADDQLLGLLVQQWPARLAVRVGQAPATRRRCQPSNGVANKHDQRARGSTRLAAASSARSAGSSLGAGVCRRSTATWWRSTRISRSLAASPRASNPRSWMEWHSARYASSRQHRRTSAVGGTSTTLPSRDRRELAAHRPRPTFTHPSGLQAVSGGVTPPRHD
jgi:hypothetical protein